MSPFKNVLLIGASGRVGTAIQTELLAKKSNFSKLGVLTASGSAPNPEKEAYFAFLEAQGVEIIRVDFSDRNALVKTFKGIRLSHHDPASIKLLLTSLSRMGRRHQCSWFANGEDAAADD
jgi:hypothetical protein